MEIRRIADFIKRLPSYVHQGRHSIVIEESNGKIKITETRVNDEEKTIKILNELSGENIDEFKKPFFKADYLIFAMDRKNATTIKNAVHLLRTEPKTEITEGEFEELLSNGLWKFIDEYRVFSAKKMGTLATEISVVDIAVSEIFIDEHRVVSPVGIRGKKLSFDIRATFLSKSASEMISKVEGWAEKTYAIESNGILSAFISGENDIAIFCDENGSQAFFAYKNRVSYVGEINWKMTDVIDAIMKKFLVSENNAKIFVSKLASNTVSSHINIILSKIISDHLKTLTESIRSSFKKRAGTKIPIFHLLFSIPIAEQICWLKKDSRFKINTLDEKFDELGFTVIAKKDSKRADTKTLIFASHPILFPSNKETEKLLSRRAKWLINHSN